MNCTNTYQFIGMIFGDMQKDKKFCEFGTLLCFFSGCFPALSKKFIKV